MLAHGSAVGIGAECHLPWPWCGHHCHLDRALRREIQSGLKILSPYGAERPLRGYRYANNEIQPDLRDNAKPLGI
jgi:hypothetical protein